MTEANEQEARDRFFSGGGAWGWNASINWAPGEFHGYVEGFWRSALFTVQTSEPHDLDRVVYPVCFCTRQFLELSLKDLIATCKLLDQEERAFPKTHFLPALWGELKGHLRTRAPGIAEQLTNVADAVTAFHSIDPTGEAFRYPVLRDGSNPIPLDYRTINLVEHIKQMITVHDDLETLDMMLSHQLDVQNEIAQAYLDWSP